MKMLLISLLGLMVTPGIAPLAPGPVPGDDAWWQRRDQQEASRAMRMGQILPLRAIEARILPTMRGSQYLGVDFEPERGIYTLKFLRNGTVIWVEVDGRSGQVIGRTSN